MTDHYYTREPTSAHKPGELKYTYRGAEAVFQTDSGVFSRTEIDKGTMALLNALPETLTGEVPDIGCGYGAIGVSVGKHWSDVRVTMSDVNLRACGLAEANARRNGVRARVVESDGYAALDGAGFDHILQNPPIRAGKATIYAMFRDAAAHMQPGGSLWLVIRKQQGAASALKYLQTLYHDAAVVDKDAGFWVLRCARPIDANDTTEGTTKDDL